MSEINNNNFFVQIKRKEEGIKLYKEALKRCPNNPASFIFILYGSGEIEESEILEEHFLSDPKLTKDFLNYMNE